MIFKGCVILVVMVFIVVKGVILLMFWVLKEIIEVVDVSINLLLSVFVVLFIVYGLLCFVSVFFGEVCDVLFGWVIEYVMCYIGLKVFKYLYSLEFVFYFDR